MLTTRRPQYLRGRRPQRLAAAVLLAGLALAACGNDGDPESSEEDDGQPTSDDGADAGPTRFAGETLTLIVPYSPGGGYDVYLRTLAPYLEEIGQVTAVVENQPGAGGLQAANSMFSNTGDPTQMLIANGPGFASAWISGAEGVRFEFDGFTTLGRLVSEPHVLGVSGEGDVTSFNDLLDAQSFSYGVTGPGSTAVINATVLGEVFDLDVEVVPGFEGSGEIQTALIRGDIDVMSIEPSSGQAAIEAGEFTPLVYLSDERSPLLPDVPALTELELTDEQMELLDVHFALFDIGRTLLAPPDLDDADAEALRALVNAAITDEGFVSEMGDRPVAFASGDEVQSLVEVVANAPESYIDLIRQAYE